MSSDNVPPGYARDIFDLSGRVAVITGGGSGLGRAIAIGYAQCGVTVVVADIDEEGAAETVATIAEQGGTAVAVPFLGGLRALDAVAAHEDRQAEVASQQAPDGARRIRLADDIFDEPVLIEYVAGLVVDGAGVRLDELDRPLVDLLRHDAGEQQIAVLAEVDDAELVEAWRAVVDA